MEVRLKVDFKSPLRVEVTNVEGRDVLIEDFIVVIETERTGEFLTIPAGFYTDYDSVPRLPLFYWLLKNRARKSAVLHDYMYYTQRGREFADEVFYEAMKEETNAFYRGLIWAGVRIGGGAAYAKYSGNAANPDGDQS